jgi:Na+/proline symporter
MSGLDHSIVFFYISGLFIITFFSLKSKGQLLSSEMTERKVAEKQFLAGRNATTLEAVFSIAATEFSALTFIQLPALAMIGKRGLLWGLFGIMLGRWLVSRFLLRNFYRTGLTVFDSLSKGVKNYAVTNLSAKRAQRLMAILYFFSKILSVSAAIYLGSNFVSKFYNVDFQWIIIAVIIITSLYTIIGGLKAVMRTDILQFVTICIGGIILTKIAFEKSEQGNVFELLKIANTVSFGTSGLIPVLVGFLSGFISDFVTHGVEQDFVQKLKACRTPSIASKAVIWSTWLSIAMQTLFIFIGAAFVIGRPGLNDDLSASMNLFMDLTVGSMGTGTRGLVVVAILSATMSSLDSSLNALSSVLWNDILPQEQYHRRPIFIKIDNTVVAMFVGIFAFFVGQNPNYVSGFLNINSVVLLPVVCCFILRFVFYPRVMFGYGLHTVMFTIFSCVFGIVLNTFYLNLPFQMSIFPCLFFSMVVLWFYEKLKLYI